jgi:hypothetical protein
MQSALCSTAQLLNCSVAQRKGSKAEEKKSITIIATAQDYLPDLPCDVAFDARQQQIRQSQKNFGLVQGCSEIFRVSMHWMMWGIMHVGARFACPTRG